MVKEFLEGLFGRSESQEDRTIDPNTFNESDPEQNTREYLQGAVGIPEEHLDFFMSNEDAQNEVLRQHFSKNVGRRPISDEEVSEWINTRDHSKLLASGDRQLQSLGRTLQLRDDKEAREGGSSNNVRERIKQGVPPELHHFIDALDDRGVSMLAGKQLEEGLTAHQQGNIGYNREKDAPKLKIVQDDAFLRSGYKSGDTVCVKIP